MSVSRVLVEDEVFSIFEVSVVFDVGKGEFLVVFAMICEGLEVFMEYQRV